MVTFYMLQAGHINTVTYSYLATIFSKGKQWKSMQ